jgi:hypothetical protein
MGNNGGFMRVLKLIALRNNNLVIVHRDNEICIITSISNEPKAPVDLSPCVRTLTWNDHEYLTGLESIKKYAKLI